MNAVFKWLLKIYNILAILFASGFIAHMAFAAWRIGSSGHWYINLGLSLLHFVGTFWSLTLTYWLLTLPGTCMIYFFVLPVFKAPFKRK